MNEELFKFLERMEQKIDIVANELNKNIVSTNVLSEKINTIFCILDEVKRITIPEAVANSAIKTKLWVAMGIVAFSFSIILSIFSFLLK